ncbi:unnamed protein product [Oikopleura dioica]|uniref:TMC domain-containing protein n=1 Tax=Oikopleura dioica TaxID=34765 RepID=E4YFS8_OIKDI|nr:unnamed protein product [Oikopleura dioica]
MLASNSSLSGNGEKVGECWESSVGQELAKLILFDILIRGSCSKMNKYRGLICRYLNPIWPFWDLEGTYPEYAEFKLADNILHLIYNQGILWLSCYFAPVGPRARELTESKLILIFYLRCWSVLTTNLPSKRIFRASRLGFHKFKKAVCKINNSLQI